MVEIDFITALGRLLRDGKLRDAFAADPQAVAAQIKLRPSDWPDFLQLIPADLEFQAQILLRKRLELVRHLLPETTRRAGDQFDPAFFKYARTCWPPELRAALQDAFEFCRELKRQQSIVVDASEWNRLVFAISRRRTALHWVQMATRNKKIHRGFQIFLRINGQNWREIFLYLGL